MMMEEEGVKAEEGLGVFAHEMYFTLDVRLLMRRVVDHRPSTNMLRPQWRLMPILQLILSFPCSHRSHKHFLRIHNPGEKGSKTR
jgi:hypothetical protein